MSNAAAAVTDVEVGMMERIANAQSVFVDVMLAMKRGGVEAETISVALTDLAGTLAGTQPDAEVGARLATVYAEAKQRAENNQQTKGEHHE
jgi:hypothetical protein